MIILFWQCHGVTLYGHWFLINKYGFSHLLPWRLILFCFHQQLLNTSWPQLTNSNFISSCGNGIHLRNSFVLLSHWDGACLQSFVLSSDHFTWFPCFPQGWTHRKAFGWLDGWMNGWVVVWTENIELCGDRIISGHSVVTSVKKRETL